MPEKKNRERVRGYIRVSADKQDVENQRLEILKYCNTQDMHVEFVEVTVSTRQSVAKRKIDELMDLLYPGTILIVMELSRLARSMRECLDIIHSVQERGARLISLREGLDLDPDSDDIQSTVTLGLFSLLYELERKILSQRTKEGLRRAIANGKRPGCKQGQILKSKLDPYKDQISHMLGLGFSKAQISRVLNCSADTVTRFIKTRKVKPHPNPEMSMIARTA